MNFLKKTDNYLLTHHPEIWLSRIHFIVPGAVVVFLAELMLGKFLPLSTTSSLIIIYLISLFLFFIVAWWRFQKQNFDPNLSLTAIYRLFICNTFCIALLAGLIFVIPAVLSARAGRTVNQIEKDLFAVRIDNISESQVASIKELVEESYRSLKNEHSILFSVAHPPWLMQSALSTHATSDIIDGALGNPFLFTEFSRFSNTNFFDTALHRYYDFSTPYEQALYHNNIYTGPALRSLLIEDLLQKTGTPFLHAVMDVLIVKSPAELDSIKRNAAAVYGKYGFSEPDYKNSANGIFLYAHEQGKYFDKLDTEIRSVYSNYRFLINLYDAIGIWIIFGIILFSFLSVAILLNKNIWLSISIPLSTYAILILLGFLFLNKFESSFGLYYFIIIVLFLLLWRSAFRKRPSYSLLISYKLQACNYAIMVVPLIIFSFFEDYNLWGIYSYFSVNTVYWIIAICSLALIALNYFFIRRYHQNLMKPG